MKKLKVAQIGTEHDHASEIFETVRGMDEYFDVAGFCLIEEEGDALYQERKARFEGAPLLTPEAILNDSSVDAVLVESRDDHLTRYARLALEHGKAVQMDKPGSPDGTAFEAMLDLAKEKDLPIQLGYMYRFNPVLEDLYRRIEAGEFGEILYVNAEMSCCHREGKRRWLADYPGGMMYFLGCHLVDILFRIQGEPLEILPANAKSGIGGVDAVDEGLALFRYPRGVSMIRACAVERGGYIRRNVLVVGTEGTCEIRPTEYVAEEGAWNRMATDARYIFEPRFFAAADVVKSPHYNRYEGMMKSFYEIAARQKENPYTVEYEKQLHRLILKACEEK